MYYTVLYCTVLYSTLLYSTLLYSTVLYYRAKLQYKLLSQILCWRVEEAVQAVEEPKTLRFSSIIFCARYIIDDLVFERSRETDQKKIDGQYRTDVTTKQTRMRPV